MRSVANIADKLVGLEFTGQFQRLPRFVQVAEREMDELKEQHPDIYQERLSQHETNNGLFETWMKIMDYDQETGFFLAKGNDHFGQSRMVGRMQSMPSGAEIGFMKLYGTEFREDAATHILLPMRGIQYTGTISIPDDKITIGGNHQPDNMPANYRGWWRLDSVETV